MHDALPELPISQHRLDNGLRIVLQPDSSLPLVAVNLWYHVGSKDETPGLTGLAHLFEHMLFQGSAHVGTNDHFRLLQQVGGVANGSTWYDRTNYYETVPSNHLDLALWLESDRMGFLLPALTAEKLENQRQVVLNERRQRIDNQPYGRAFETLQAMLHPPTHPYHWPVIGTCEDIARASLDDVSAFFRAHYHPSNAVLSLVGDFRESDALERIDRFFGELRGGPDPPAVERPFTPLTQATRVVLADRVAAERLYFGFLVPPYGQDAWWTADLLAQVLSGGKSSVLYRELVVEQQLASEISAFVLPTELAATWGIVATALPGSSADELEAAIRRQLSSVTAAPPAIEDLERARNRTVTAFHETVQSFDQRADLLSRNATQRGSAGLWREELERYLAVTAEELSVFAETFLADRASALVRVVPEETPS